MNINSTLKSLAKEAVIKAQKGIEHHIELPSNKSDVSGKNEFLFFIKPEITALVETPGFDKALDMIFSKFEEFKLKIKMGKVLSSEYLKNHKIISQHYGVINQLASNAKETLSTSAKDKFLDIFGDSVNELNVLGGLEFLKKFNHFNPISLDHLWQNNQNVKLAGGTYCEKIKIDGEEIYLINGFHPRQLLHFTDKGRAIIIFTLIGDTSWTKARTSLIGSTNPATAKSGSIRNNLLDNKNEFGLNEVSQGMNGVHLSAGPVEGLVELMRYGSNFSNGNKVLKPKDFNFGKALSSIFSDEQLSSIINNENLDVDGEFISTFDLTEEKDSDEALEILRKYTK